VDHYRIIDADYAVVGLKSDLAEIAPDTADALRRDGLRLGLILLEAGASLRPEIAGLVAQVLALGVIESARTNGQMTSALVELLQTAVMAPDWYFPGRVPRVYSAVLSPSYTAPRREHLIKLTKAMRVHAPDRLILTADGLVKPAPVLHPVR
jgi:hypothetical protein